MTGTVATLSPAQTALIRARRTAVRLRLEDHMREATYHRLTHEYLVGEAMDRRELMLARACMAGDGRHLLRTKVWRAIGWELRFPPFTWIHKIDGATWRRHSLVMDRRFVQTVTGGATWQPAFLSDALDTALTFDSDADDLAVLAWIGGGFHSEGHSHDSSYQPPGYQERVADVAKAYRASISSTWETDGAARYANTVEWWQTRIGLAWNTAVAAAPALTLEVFTEPNTPETETLTGDAAREWAIGNLEAWIALGVRAFFDFHPRAVLREKLDERRLVNVNPVNHVLGKTRLLTAYPADAWTAVQAAPYTAAAAYDEDAALAGLFAEAGD